MTSTTLTGDQVTRLRGRLAATDEMLESDYPGESARRQPVHTVYVRGDRVTAATPGDWGRDAIALAQAHGGTASIAERLGATTELAARLGDAVEAKLRSQPVEDLRMDFEDGYGDHGDAEDSDVLRAAGLVRRLLDQPDAPAYVGIRFKCFERATIARGLRTLDLFVTEVARGGPLPDQLVLTFPKVSTVSQVEAMTSACEQLEAGLGLPPGRLSYEIQVETPQLILGVDGIVTLAPALRAGRGRVTGLHYGTYDYSASMLVAAAHQSMEHPVADQAKAIMQLVAAGTGVHVSDGSTNIVPVGDEQAVWRSWALHHRLVSRSLAAGISQGWDMHPGHLVTRYLATYEFYLTGYDAAATRLRDYVQQREGAVMDEPATVRALARFLSRATVCGAVDGTTVARDTTIDVQQLATLARPKSDTEAIRERKPVR